MPRAAHPAAARCHPRQIAGRFSRMAVAAVAVLAVTGACGRWELSSVSQIWTTSYGRTLLAKTLLL